MTMVLLTFDTQLLTTDGRAYTARACGRERTDRLWEGWIEFVPDDASSVLRSGRETTQPNLADLQYWATGLTPVYLEGALARALAGPPRERAAPRVEAPTYEAPAPAAAEPEGARVADPVPQPVLDPFSVYTKGEDRLRQQLRALSAGHLRTIVRAYDLAIGRDMDLEVLTEAELVALIVSGVRDRLAA
jgi:hypothetical protein